MCNRNSVDGKKRMPTGAQLLSCFLVLTALMILTELFQHHRWIEENGKAGVEGGNVDMIDLSNDGKVDTLPTVVTIDTAHRKNLPHRGVWIFLLDPTASHCAFFHRSKSHKTCGSSWNILGEHSKAGESYRDTCLRGLKEELGIDARDLKHFQSIYLPERLHVSYPLIERADTQAGFITFPFLTNHPSLIVVIS